MIGWLSGTLKEKRPPHLLLAVGGVGYELEAPMTTIYQLPEVGQEVALHIHQQVREDSLSLYAFAAVRDREVFRALLKVNGVGAKVALAILSGLDPDALARCISAGDTGTLAKIPGIGKKTAERLVVEMRDRMPGALPGGAGGGVPGAGSAWGVPGDDPSDEAVAALVALGFKPQEASRRIRGIEAPGLRPEELVRLALKSVARA